MYVTIDKITKSFGADIIFENISVTINENDRIGLIGSNGAGKTTFLRVLNKEIQADSGNISYMANLTVGYLKQNSGLTSGNTVYEEMRSVFASAINAQKEMERLTGELEKSPQDMNLARAYDMAMAEFVAKDGYNIDVNINKILNGMGFSNHSKDTVIDTMSGGEKTRLALSKLLLQQPKLLILDEPTNHLDMQTLLWIEGYLTEYKGAVLVVSHDRYFLDKVTGKTWEIEDGELTEYKGNYSAYKIQKQERTTFLLKEYEKQVNKRESMADFAKRNIARASTSNMAKSRLKQIDQMDPIKKPKTHTPSPSFRFSSRKRSVQDVLEVKDVTLCVGSENKLLADEICTEVKRGDSVAIIGANGTGKSTFLKAINGNDFTSGEIYWGKNVEVGYYDQENKDMNAKHTALEELWKRYSGLPEQVARGFLGRVLIVGDEVYKKVESLSGGERAKLGFAILMAGEHNVLLLDEPTNHLDLLAREELERALKEYDGTLIFVSHDRYFINALANRVLLLEQQKMEEYVGNYDNYIIQKEAKKEVVEKESEKKTGINVKNVKILRQQKAKLRIRLSEIEKKIAKLEEEEKELRILMEENSADFEKLEKICTRLEEISSEHEFAMEEWMMISEENNAE